MLNSRHIIPNSPTIFENFENVYIQDVLITFINFVPSDPKPAPTDQEKIQILLGAV